MIKTKILLSLKKIANRFGYDVKYYHPYYSDLLKKYSFKTILDIGANDGQFVKDAHIRLSDAQLYSFEPLNEPYEALKKNMANVKNFKAFRFALGSEPGKMEMNKSSFSPSSSLLTMTSLHKKIYPKSAGSTTEEITIMRLDDLASEMSLKKPLLVKMDVQGFEDKVIAGAVQTLGKADMVLVETSFVPLYEGQPLFGDIHNALQKLGFSYHGNREQHWNSKTGELLYEDSIFLKN